MIYNTIWVCPLCDEVWRIENVDIDWTETNCPKCKE